MGGSNPESVKEMTLLMGEARLHHDHPAPSGSPAVESRRLGVARGGEEGAATDLCHSPETRVPVGVAKVVDPSEKAGGPVSLSQILERSVFSDSASDASANKSHDLAPMPHATKVPQKNMGNGTSGLNTGIHLQSQNQTSTNSNNTSGHPGMPKAPTPDYNERHLQKLVPELKNEIRDRDLRIEVLTSETLNLRRQLKKRNEELSRIQQEVDKLKSVLHQKTSPIQEPGDIVNSLNAIFQNGEKVSAKKQGVSGESFGQQKASDKILIQHFEKDFQSKQLIREAILDNDFLKHLDSGQIREIVDSMYSKEFSASDWLIREGSVGTHLFVSAEGDLEVLKEGKVLGKISPGKAFGELAILYNCTRTASVRAVNGARVWAIERKSFQQVMVRQGLKRMEDNLAFLSSIPLFKNLSNEHLSRIADALELDVFAAGSYIIRQGTSGDSFYIIRSGRVKITQRVKGKQEEETVRILQEGNYFGEKALLKEECRTANVISLPPGVECLTLDRNSFIQLIGEISELRDRDYGDEGRGVVKQYTAPHDVAFDQEYSHIRLTDLEVIATLGVGGFGRVELVQFTHDKSKTFALKCLKKKHIVETQQQEHIFSEKRIMMSVRNPFICRLYKTFRDSKCVYMLMEACLGGEVWTILRDRGWFDDNTSKFYTACVVEALDYLHSRGIIYRDLKPENLLLDARGYAKMVDFGFSKELVESKTWTFCGTPEYVAPEIILNRGHDRAVDYWSIGVLMFELLTGTPPFTASEPIKTYNVILRGIDQIDFPSHITKHANNLIKRLCREHPGERLGYQKGGVLDIKKHKWFQGFDWEGLLLRTLKPPILPKIRSPSDASNFDKYPRDLDVPPDELSGWDLTF